MKQPRSSVAWLALLASSGCSGGAPSDAPAPTASGAFESLVLAVPAAGDWYAADLDLDGRDELLLTQPSGRTRVYELNGRHELDQVATLPAAKWLTIGDVTADGLPDVLLGGDSFQGFRGLDERSFSPLQADSVPVSGEASGRISVTSFPIVGRFRTARPEPLVVKDVYDLALLSPQPTQVEAFAASEGEVASVGNAELEVPLNLRKRFVAMDLEGDGRDELWGVDFLGQLTQLRPPADPEAAGFLVAHDWPVDDPLQLTTGDANGDGAPDLLAVASALVVTGGTAQGPGRVHELALPSAARSCVWLQLDADAERELACAGADGESPTEAAVYDVDFTRDELTPRALPELSLAGQLLVGDFDGNGVEDLAAIGDELVLSLGVAAD